MHQQDRRVVPTWGGNAPVAVSIMLILLCLVLLAWFRGGWLDEYWTIWHSDPTNPLSVAYHTRWLRDTQHPPTFYALGWTLAPLVGMDVAWRRLVINGLALLFVIPTILACRRELVSPQQPPLYLLMMIAGPFLVTYFAEYRSYFLALSATACLVAVTRKLHMDVAQHRPLRRGTVALFALLTLIASNLHYTMSLCAFAFLACECLWQWCRGNRGVAVLIALAVAVSLAPLTINLLAALSVASPTPVVDQSIARGWMIIAAVVASVPLSNVVLTYQAAQALRRPRAMRAEARGFVIVLGASLAIIVAGFLTMHVLTHNMFPRLVLGLIPVATASICELAAQFGLNRRMLLFACLNAVVVASLTTALQLRNRRWEAFVPEIRKTVAACPSTRVIAVPSLRFAYEPSRMTGQTDAMVLGYRLIARKRDLPVDVAATGALNATNDPRCPTLVWVEHNFFRPDVTAEQLYQAALSGPVPSRDRLKLQHRDEHFLLTVGPPR